MLKKAESNSSAVKKLLQKLKASYAMLYPSRLCISIGGQAHFYENAAEAFVWLDHNEHAFCPHGRLSEGDA